MSGADNKVTLQQIKIQIARPGVEAAAERLRRGKDLRVLTIY